MNSLDIVVCSLLILALWRGWLTGVLMQLSGIAGLIIGAWVAKNFSQHLAQWLNIAESDTVVLFIVTLIIVMVGVVIALSLLNKVLTWSGLSFPIRFLGALTSAAKYLLIISLAISLYTRFSDSVAKHGSPEVFRKSRSYHLLNEIGGIAYPYLEKTITEFYMPKQIADSTVKENVTDEIGKKRE